MAGVIKYAVEFKKIIEKHIYWVVLVRLRRLFYYIKYKQAAPVRDEIIYVDPENVKKDCYMCVSKRRGYKYHIDRNESIILDGDWDHEMRNFRDMGIEKYEKLHKSLDRHFKKGLSWESTELYDYLRHGTIDDKRYHDLDERFEEIEDIYKSIQTEGYQRQGWKDEIAIGIGRDGELCRIYDGTHRLRMAKILDIDEVPVRVAVRHKKWQRLRYKLSVGHEVEYDGEGRYNQLRDHPDLQDVIN